MRGSRFPVGDELLPFPLTERSVHLCVDMQRMFSVEGLWPTPWMDRVLPLVSTLAGRYPERTIFTRFIPPERPDQIPGMWQRYYTRWRAATREYLDVRLLELMHPLSALCPPARVIDKTRYSDLFASLPVNVLLRRDARNFRTEFAFFLHGDGGGRS